MITHEQKTKIPALKKHLDLLGEFFIISINLAGALSASISSILAYTFKENNHKILVIIITTFQIKFKSFIILAVLDNFGEQAVRHSKLP